VQKSAYPDAYAKHEPLATLVVNVLTDGAARAVGAITTLRCAAPGELSASGWTAPLAGEVVSGFQTPERRDHYGVDIAASKGTPIHAASAGIVLVSTCNAFGPNGGVYSCDRDGSPAVSGCGWYVDIEHAGNIITRYCHLVSRPNVQVGQLVAGGQLIGRSGSSGNSSGPHLHYEVHERGDSSRRGATDPVKFMQDRGAPLGVPAP
jgi:murein DD-endopeptidase MepM/ murein hydrolase activator NlpD